MYLLQLIYISWGRVNIQHSMIANNKLTTLQLKPVTRSIANIYFIIMCICHPPTFNVRFSQRKHCLTKETIPSSNSKNYIRIFGNTQQSCLLCINGRYIRHKISASPFIFGQIFYSTKTWS